MPIPLLRSRLGQSTFPAAVMWPADLLPPNLFASASALLTRWRGTALRACSRAKGGAANRRVPQ